MHSQHPFANLSPDTILSAIETLGIWTDGRLLALNSYENRVYQVGIQDAQPVVVKFYRPQRWSDNAILEEHLFLQDLYSHEIPVVPAMVLGGNTLHVANGFRFALFEKHGGRAPELDRQGVLEWIGRFIGRIHAIGSTSTFVNRPSIDIQSFGVLPSQFLLDSEFIPYDLKEVYRGVVQHALEAVQTCFDRAGDVRQIRLHGDCHMGNLLWTADGLHFVDFDDSRMGPAIQDLWMMLSGTSDEMRQQFNQLLAGYECFFDFDPSELHLIEALRTLRLIHYSAWIASRWDDPAFPVAFPWFNTQQYWQDRVLELREQIALMAEPPLSVLGGNC